MGHVDPTKEVFAQFRANDRPGPIHMLNLVRLRAQAAYPDGRRATGAEAYAAYGRESGPVFERLGGRIVWQGRFELMLIGPEAERWNFVPKLRRKPRSPRWSWMKPMMDCCNLERSMLRANSNRSLASMQKGT